MSDFYHDECDRIFNHTMPSVSGNGRTLSEYMDLLNISINDLYNLQDKKLLLVGGGRSPIATELNQKNIKCNVTNVDMYTSNPDPMATNIKQDFVSTNFRDEFDQCWAVYSLPLYSPSPYHGAAFYVAAAIALRPGGTLRVTGLPQDMTGIISAPHLSRDTGTFLLMDLLLQDTFSTTIKTAYCINNPKIRYQTWTAPTTQSGKQKFNNMALINLKRLRAMAHNYR